jgi:hypothetical protein
MRKKRAVASARAFLNDARFDVIVEILRLNPVGDWTQWADVEGNSLKISKNGAIHVYPSKEIGTVTNDVYRKARPQAIASHSYWMLAIFGQTQSILSFLGNDGMFRCCYFENDIWKYNIQPLLLGYQALSYVASGYIDTETRKVRIPKISYPKNFNIEEVWASSYSATDLQLFSENSQERLRCHLMTNQSLLE